MANRLSYGFKIAYSLVGDHVRPLEFNVADDYQASISGGNDVHFGTGDVCYYTDAGGVAMANGAETTVQIPYGVVVGVKQYFDGVNVRSGEYIPGASTGGGVHKRRSIVQVIPMPWAIWSAEVDEAVTATTRGAYEALIHRNVQHISTEATSGRQSPKLDISEHNTTATFGLRIVGIDETQDVRDFSLAGVRLLVAANASSFPTAATPVVGI